MDDAELLHTSRREHALYRELAAVYHAMASALRDECAPVDPAWVRTTDAQAEGLVAALRDTAAVLAPYRLSGADVPAEATTLWRDSARLAAEASALGPELIQLARARQAAVAARLGQLMRGRRAAAAYRSTEASGY
jgi:hypothetical protein